MGAADAPAAAQCPVSLHAAVLARVARAAVRVASSANPDSPRPAACDPALADSALLLRFLVKANYCDDAAAAHVAAHLLWRAALPPTLSPGAAQFLHMGIFRFHAQDRRARPTLIINIAKYSATAHRSKQDIEDFKQCLIHVLEVGRRCVEDINRQHMGGESSILWKVQSQVLIHQLSVIVDLEGVGLSNVNYDMLPMIVKLFQTQYPGVFGTLYVLNFGWLHSGIWSIVKRALTAEACAKLLFLTKEEMPQYFDRALLMEEHGGTCKMCQSQQIFAKYENDSYYQQPTLRVPTTPHIRAPSKTRRPACLSAPPTPFQTFHTPSTALKPTEDLDSDEIWFDAPLSLLPTPAMALGGGLFSPGMVATLGLEGGDAAFDDAFALPANAVDDAERYSDDDGLSTIVAAVGAPGASDGAAVLAAVRQPCGVCECCCVARTHTDAHAAKRGVGGSARKLLSPSVTLLAGVALAAGVVGAWRWGVFTMAGKHAQPLPRSWGVAGIIGAFAHLGVLASADVLVHNFGS
ncbi:hypothetical protein HDU82_008708 [Entophlyctis luteolus]|nr:hypothetical protein HDU82_008708 [Entophlyctis luteolus]